MTTVNLTEVTINNGLLTVVLSNGKKATVQLHPEGNPEASPAERVIERLYALAQMLENHTRV